MKNSIINSTKTLALVMVFSATLHNTNAQKIEAIATISDNTTTTSVDYVFTPENGTANDYISSALAREGMNDLQGAYLDYSMAINLDENNYEIYDKRGVIALKLLMFKKAIKDFTKALSLNDTKYEIYSHRGIAYYCVENYEKALADYNSALTLNPHYAKAIYNRGLVNYMMENDDAAVVDFINAADLNYLEAKNILEQFKFESYNK